MFLVRLLGLYGSPMDENIQLNQFRQSARLSRAFSLLRPAVILPIEFASRVKYDNDGAERLGLWENHITLRGPAELERQAYKDHQNFFICSYSPRSRYNLSTAISMSPNSSLEPNDLLLHARSWSMSAA